MFLQRLITSLILVPIVLLGLFYAHPRILGAVILVVMFIVGMECWKLIPLQSIFLKIGYLLVLFFSLWLCGVLYSYWLIAGLVLWLFIILAILTYSASERVWGYPFIVALGFLCVLPLFAQSLASVYFLPQGKGLLVYLLFVVWAADVGAYLAGKCWGTHKLIPQVSPGKSWEGFLGGFGLAMLITTIGYYYFRPESGTKWFVLAAVVVVISVFGDLFISILKRRCHLKDTGAIIPGHGGLLDRLDSLIAAMPAFYFGLMTCF